VEHHFDGHAYTIGIEEELMILDAGSLELVNAIEAMLEPAPAGEIKPELMESVLEISTAPCENVTQASEQLRALRRQVTETASSKGMAIGSAGTHPFAMWEDQRIVARPRYRDLISALRFVARQEVIFGMHVHVGIDDPDKAIHVANGMCRSGGLTRPGSRPRGRRSSAPSRGSGSRPRTTTGPTTSAGSSS
jgi:carboxylate-amine ligase